MWFKVGKDPAKGNIVVQFEPPHNLSPAAMRFIRRMGYDQKAFTSAIINMAVKGFLTIEDEKGQYKLIRNTEDMSALSHDEKAVANKLFSSGSSSIELKNTNHATFSSAIRAFRNALKTEYEMEYFVTNVKYFAWGIVISVVFFILGFVFFPAGGETALIIFINLMMGFFIIMALVSGVKFIKAGRAGTKGCVANWFVGLMMIGMGTIFMGAFAFSFFSTMTASGSSVWFFVSAVFLFLLNYIYYRLLKAPTMKGRKVMDLIEGFEMYLDATEKNRMQVLNPPAKTIDLFERFLPYALAFNIEGTWASYFSDVMKEATQVSSTGRGYSPSWYRGAGWSTLGATGFAQSLGSNFSSALQSSSQSPSSSGGGGSYGGGGGGGGGGGW